MLTVEAQVRLGAGQEVFRRRSWYSTATVVKSRVIPVAGIAGIHSQKIGNALRTIDTGIQRLMNWGYSRGTLRFCNQSRCGLPSTERKLDFIPYWTIG